LSSAYYKRNRTCLNKSTGSTATAIVSTTPAATRYNKVVSKDSRRTLTSKKNLKDARHL
jgi:transcription initiation factor TFIID subunit TAF12